MHLKWFWKTGLVSLILIFNFFVLFPSRTKEQYLIIVAGKEIKGQSLLHILYIRAQVKASDGQAEDLDRKNQQRPRPRGYVSQAQAWSHQKGDGALSFVRGALPMCQLRPVCAHPPNFFGRSCSICGSSLWSVHVRGV